MAGAALKKRVSIGCFSVRNRPDDLTLCHAHRSAPGDVLGEAPLSGAEALSGRACSSSNPQLGALMAGTGARHECGALLSGAAAAASSGSGAQSVLADAIPGSGRRQRPPISSGQLNTTCTASSQLSGAGHVQGADDQHLLPMTRRKHLRNVQAVGSTLISAVGYSKQHTSQSPGACRRLKNRAFGSIYAVGSTMHVCDAVPTQL